MPSRLALLVSMVAAVTVGCAGTGVTEAADREPIIISVNPMYAIWDFDTLIAKSEFIVLGEVIGVKPSRWSTPDGTLPAGTTVGNISTDLLIYTDAEVWIRQTVKGDIRASGIRVRMLGGQVGQDQMTVAGEPRLERGREYVLFMVRDSGRTEEVDPGAYMNIGGPDSVYSVANGKATSGEDVWELEELLDYIRERAQ